MEKARSAGMNAYIAKPVEPSTIRNVLEQVMPFLKTDNN